VSGDRIIIDGHAFSKTQPTTFHKKFHDAVSQARADADHHVLAGISRLVAQAPPPVNSDMVVVAWSYDLQTVLFALERVALGEDRYIAECRANKFRSIDSLCRRTLLDYLNGKIESSAQIFTDKASRAIQCFQKSTPSSKQHTVNTNVDLLREPVIATLVAKAPWLEGENVYAFAVPSAPLAVVDEDDHDDDAPWGTALLRVCHPYPFLIVEDASNNIISSLNI
jgi:hypothetical protein